MIIKQCIFFMLLISSFWLCNAGKSGGDSHITQSWSSVLSYFSSEEIAKWKKPSNCIKEYFLTDKVPAKPILCLYCSLCNESPVAFKTIFAHNGHCNSNEHKVNKNLVERNQVALHFFNFHKKSKECFR